MLDIQTANGIVVPDTQAKGYIRELGADLWVHVVKDVPLVLSFVRLCNQEKLPDYQKVRK